MPKVIESLEEFTDRQDCEYLEMEDRRIFRNGAQAIVSGVSTRPWIFREKATGVINKTRAMYQFDRIKIDRLIERYHRNLENYNNAVKYGRDDGGAYLVPLRKQAEEIKKLKDSCRTKEKVLPEFRERRRRARLEANERSEREELMKEIQKLPTFTREDPEPTQSIPPDPRY